MDENKCLHCGENKPGYCEDCYQALIAENARLQEFKTEHKIMKKILIEHGLWETLLNDDDFIDHLKEEDE